MQMVADHKLLNNYIYGPDFAHSIDQMEYRTVDPPSSDPRMEQVGLQTLPTSAQKQ